MEFKNLIIRIFSSTIFILIYIFLSLKYPHKIFHFISIIYIIIFFEILFYFPKKRIYIITYLLISYICLIIYFNVRFDNMAFTIILLCIICFDSFCYFIGKSFGKHKLFFKISPNKTYEGLVGGILVTNLFTVYLYSFTELINTTSYLNIILFTNVIILFSFFGDLLQSYFKRSNKLKDSSNFIPGHGGFFDRFDSFLLVIIPFSIMKILI